MRRKIIALMSTLAMASFGVVMFPGAAMASNCVLTAENNPNTGHAHRRGEATSFPDDGAVIHQACYKLGVHGAQGGLFYFHLEVQDTIVVPTPGSDTIRVSDLESCVEMQWRTPGTTPWVTKVRDCDSADWLHDGWLSPLMNPIANGLPTSFDFRVKLTTRYLHGKVIPLWKTHTAYTPTMTVDY